MEAWMYTSSYPFILLVHLHLYPLLQLVARIHKVFTRCIMPSLQSRSDNFIFSVDGNSYQPPKETPVSPIRKLEKLGETSARQREDLISREEIHMILGFMGIEVSESEEEEEDKGGAFFDDATSTFEDEEPSLREVKEAFHVFDHDRDGFIEPKDLQRVLTSLGLQEGLSLTSCRKMISLHDTDRDGKIEFHDFVKLMEGSFSSL